MPDSVLMNWATACQPTLRSGSGFEPPTLCSQSIPLGQLGVAGNHCPSFFLGIRQLGATPENPEPLRIVSQLSADWIATSSIALAVDSPCGPDLRLGADSTNLSTESGAGV